MFYRVTCQMQRAVSMNRLFPGKIDEKQMQGFKNSKGQSSQFQNKQTLIH